MEAEIRWHHGPDHSHGRCIECALLRLLDAERFRITALEGERDTATSALAVLDRMAWLAAEEDLWFGNENDIAVQRAAAERHRAALSKTEGGER